MLKKAIFDITVRTALSQSPTLSQAAKVLGAGSGMDDGPSGHPAGLEGVRSCLETICSKGHLRFLSHRDLQLLVPRGYFDVRPTNKQQVLDKVKGVILMAARPPVLHSRGALRYVLWETASSHLFSGLLHSGVAWFDRKRALCSQVLSTVAVLGQPHPPGCYPGLSPYYDQDTG